LEETRAKLGLPTRNKVVNFWRWSAAAAVLLLICGATIYLLLPKRKSSLIVHHQEIAAGKAYAQLRLPNGKIIALGNAMDTVVNESISVKNGTVINSSSEGVAWNEVIIPRKSYYKVQLPDGTKVWLNSESSIRYPSSFDSIRQVEVTGETYFEVAKDASHPFVVSVGGVRVQALGTKFNISAYANEGVMTTTLIEGSVKVSDLTHEKILKPSEQIDNNAWIVKKIDAAPIEGWINNQFVLRGTSMQAIARMLERWYDVKIVFKDSINYHFNATFSRDMPISKLLARLEETGNVRFEIDNDQITVLK